MIYFPTMKVSIIVSLYRTEQYLERFLKNARKVSRELAASNIEHEIILISNEASTEEKRFLDHLTKPFRVLHVPRESIYTSWNRGVREASGEFVTFWGVDDTRFSLAIRDGVNELTLEKADYAYFPFQYHRFVRILGISLIAKVKTFTPPKFVSTQFQQEMHSGPHFMVRRSLFDRIGYFDETFRIAGDFEFQVRAAAKGAKFTRVLSISGIFRNDGTTLSGSRAALHTDENMRILKIHESQTA